MSRCASATVSPGREGPTLPQSALGELAVRCRAHGACLIILEVDGTVAFHDDGAGFFFNEYVVPALGHADLAGGAIRGAAAEVEPSSPGQAWDCLDGAILAAAPLAQRHQLRGIVLLAGRSGQFGLDPQAHLACSRLAIDPRWLNLQAQRLPAHAPGQLIALSELCRDMLAERLRLARLEEELNSLSTQLANAYEELTLIDRISSGMRVNRDSADFFRQACQDVMQVISVQAMGVALRRDRFRQEPVVVGDISLTPLQFRCLADQLIESLCLRKNCLLINDLPADSAYQPLAGDVKRLIAVPLQRGEQVLGCLFGLDKHTGDFDSTDSKLLTSIASELAIYLENAVLFGDLHDLMMGLLHSLTSAVDAKDAYTCGHSERVALLSRHLASRIGLSEAQVERVYMGGLLHDVGKIGVPESVLQKAGKLTPDEFEQIRRHPQIGARILSDVKQLEDILPGVLHHHERFDGKGYPAGLAGRDIPLMGRIICLADCFDAMTSSRTYRRALPLEVALAEIRRCSGTQFDPTLAEAFLQITPEQFRLLLHDHQVQARKLLELQESLRAA